MERPPQSIVDTPFQTIVAVPSKTRRGLWRAGGLRPADAALCRGVRPGVADGGSETIQVGGSFTAMCPYRIYAELENSSPIGLTAHADLRDAM
ncbi:MAG: hypothetical protein WDM81_00805 [Rhizomicrobium sp.]